MPSPKRKRLIDKFWSLVSKSNVIPNGFKSGHWYFHENYLRSDGYGQLPCHEGYLAHRFAYELIVGPIKPGLQIDHLCRVRRCCNPEHLEPVTRKVNILRGESPTAKNARKTVCPRGHKYDEENTYLSKEGKRQCKICMLKTVRRARLPQKLKTRKLKIVNS